MTMTEPTKAEMDALDRLLAEAAALPDPVPGAGLMARILADAEAVRPLVEPLPARPAPSGPAAAPRLGWRNWLATLGGWPALGGMAVAGITGLWLGVAPPAAVDQLVADLLGDRVAVDLLGLTDPFELEG